MSIKDPKLPMSGSESSLDEACAIAQEAASVAVNEASLANALTIVLDHLQNTIYQKAGKNLRNYVLEPIR